jgi:hypothetical protein
VSLREGLAGQAETAAMQNLQAIHADVLARIERPLKDLWPASQASLDQFELGFRPSGILLRVAYNSENKLDAAVEQVLAKALGDRFGIPNLQLLLEQQEPAPAE